MLKIGFWTEEPCLVFDAEEPRDLIRLGHAVRAIANGGAFKIPGPDGYALIGIDYLQIGNGEEQATLGENSVIVALPPPLVAEMTEKVERMAAGAAPCHNYIDLEGLTIIIALGERRLSI
jgi:hypothetical protein